MWIPYELCVDHVWVVYGLCMAHVWMVYGLSVEGMMNLSDAMSSTVLKESRVCINIKGS